MTKQSFRFATRLRALTLCALIFVPIVAKGAACCGGGHASPSLVVGDERAQVTTSFSRSYVSVDVGTDGVWRRREAEEISETLQLNAAQVIADRWQAGVSVPVVRRARKGYEESGIGDVAAQVGYEFLPEWSYHPIRPKGIGYLQASLPTGRAAPNAHAPFLLDSRGRGFWSLEAGALFTKIFGNVDSFIKFGLHRSLSRIFTASTGSIRLHPGWGGEVSVGAGLNYGDWRWGGSLSWDYEEAIRTSGARTSPGANRRVATASLSTGVLLGDDWMAMVAYSNESWIGRPHNTTLGQSLAITVQRRWLR